LYRTLEITGKCLPILLERYQKVLKEHGLIASEQIFDITSTYFEGEKAELSALGYSRDKRPEKKQVTIGIATGLTSNRFINIWEPNNQ